MAETVTFEECENGLAVVTIDRPKAINAANVKMVSEFREAIAKCKASDSVKAVLVKGAGEKGFCSGGDVKGLHPLLLADSATNVPKEQVYQEYNAIFEFRQLSVPTVALAHGITMGFGLGIGSSASYIIATEKSRFAMPENCIGLFPDACFTYIAANGMPPGIGRLMAMTGCHLVGAGDVLAAKLATHFVPMEKLPALEESLRGLDLTSDADAALCRCVEGLTGEAPAPKLITPEATLPGKVAEAKSLTEACAVLASEAEAGGWAADLAAEMKKGSPFSQALVWRLLQLAEADAAEGMAEPDRLAAALERDFAAACRVLYRPDFLEGVRAVLVDKDQAPKFQPSSLEEVSEEEVSAAVAPLTEGERTLGVAAS